MTRSLSARLVLVVMALALVGGCAGAPLAAPTSTPSPPPPSAVPSAALPSFAALTEADCPIPPDIDNGAFRAAMCPNLIDAVNALLAGDAAELVALSRAEVLDCERVLAEDPALPDDFPQCGAAPPPDLNGYVWCDPDGPECRLLGSDEYESELRRRLASVQAAASDDHGPGTVRLVGFDACGSTQFLRTTFIADGTRHVMDVSFAASPQFSEERDDEFWIRSVWAAPLEEWDGISDAPLEEGRCGDLIPWDGSSTEP